MRAQTKLWLLAALTSGVAVFTLRAGSIYVDASALGRGDGSVVHPFDTIQHGVDVAQAGDTVIVRAGTYSEQIRLHHGGTLDAPLIIAAERNGTAIVDGAVTINDFSPLSNRPTPKDQPKVWISDSYKSPYHPLDNDIDLRDAWLKEGAIGEQQVELCARNDMMWIDGQIQRQVDASDQLVANTYWIDRTKNLLYLALRADDFPDKHLIEVARRGTLFDCAKDCSYVRVKGFHFTRGAVGFGHALVNFGSPYTAGWVAEDNTADWSSWAGIHVYGSQNVISRNVAADNGDEGIGGAVNNTVLDGNTSLRNNWKGIRDSYHCGGGVFTQSSLVDVRNHEAAFNRGPGLWFDDSCSEITVEQSRLHHNKLAGILVEISPGRTMLVRNQCWANAGAGVLVGESNKAWIMNNILAMNWDGIELRNLQGRRGRFGVYGGQEEPVWQLSDITISANVLLGNARSGLVAAAVFLDSYAQKIYSDENVFWNNTPARWKAADPAAAQPPTVSATLGGYWIFDSMDLLKNFGLDAHSRARDPGFLNEDMYDFVPPPSR